MSERVQGDDVQRSLLKSEIVKLSQVLLLPDNVRRTADEFLEYVKNHHHVNIESVSKLQAFQISLCWTAASLEKHKIDHKASLVLARQHLHFDCKKEEADYIYSLLRCLKRIFLYRTGNSNITGSPKTSGFELSNKNYSCREFPPETEFLMKDISKSIKEIQKKCRKKLRKQLLKHDEDKKKLNATYEGKKADLEEKYKLESAVIPLCIPSEVMRREKLKDVDISYTKKIEDLKCQHEIHLEYLETVLLEASQKFKDREAAWVEDVNSWARDELLNILSSKEHGNLMEFLKSSEEVERDSGHVAEGANIDRIVEAMAETGVGLSKTSEQVEQVSNPIDVLPANQSSPESVMEPLEQVHQEMQNSSQQVVPVSSPVDTLPADQSNHNSVMVMEPLEQVQQLPSAQSLNSILGSAREIQKSPQQVDPVSSLVNSEQFNPSDHDSLVTELPGLVRQLSFVDSPSSNQDTSGEMLISSQQFEPVSRQADETSANQSNYESSVMEPLEQVQQLPSAESPNSNQDPSYFPLATGIELQPVNEDSLPSHVPQSLMEIADQVVVQPSSNSELDSHAPVGAFSMHSSDTRNVSTPESNNRFIQTASHSVNRMLPPLHNDPLKNELERILKEKEQRKKNHEDMKLQSKSDCQREMEEIRLKYDCKLQETEVGFQKKMKILDSNRSILLMNKIRVEAFKSKCMDLKVSGASVLQQDANFAQQRDIRPPFVASPSSRPSASTLPHFSTMTSSQTMMPPLPTMTSSQNMAPPRAISQTMVLPLPIMTSSQNMAPPRASSQTMVPPLPTMTSSQNMAPPRACSQTMVPPLPIMTSSQNMAPPRAISQTMVPPLPIMTSSQNMAPPRASSQTMVPPLPTMTSTQTIAPPRASSRTMVLPLPIVTSSQTLAPSRASSQTMVQPSTMLPPSSSPHTPVPPLPTMTGSQTVGPPRASSQTMVPPLQAGYGTSGFSSSVSARQPSINSLGNHQAGGWFLSTPPHLQSYRPMPDASRISTVQTYISDLHNRVYRPVNLSARGPSVDISSQSCANAMLHVSNVALPKVSNFSADSIIRDNSTHQPTSCDVVCLSDDD